MKYYLVIFCIIGLVGCESAWDQIQRLETEKKSCAALKVKLEGAGIAEKDLTGTAAGEVSACKTSGWWK